MGEGHGPALREANIFETEFILRRHTNRPLLSSDNNLKCLIPIILLCLQCYFFQTATPIKREALYPLVL